jgi:disulfide bond formation protein DsbB
LSSSSFRDTGVLIFGLAALLVASAMLLEHGFDMAPCALCLTQRVFFMLAGFITFIGLWPHNPTRLWPLASAAALLTGAGFALRQLYLYSLPSDQVPACSAPIGRLIEYAPLREVLTAMTVGTGDCAAAYFPFLGMQLPGILIPLSALAGFALLLALTLRQFRTLAN